MPVSLLRLNIEAFLMVLRRELGYLTSKEQKTLLV